MQYINIQDLILTPFFLLIILLIENIYKNRKIKEEPLYRFYLPGLLAKLMGGLGVCFVYTLYYNGGDTLQYFLDSQDVINLLFKKPGGFIEIVFTPNSPEKFWANFDPDTGYPVYYRDPETFMVVRIVVFLVLISFKSFFVSTILLAWISFWGIFRLFKIFATEYPEITGKVAIAILFIPSVVFWGSGLLKDTITLSCIGYYFSAFYNIFIRRKKVHTNIIILIVSAWLIISIKPYIIFGILPGSILWIVFKMLNQIRGEIARTAALPLIFIIGITFGYAMLLFLENQLAEYSMDQVLERAVVTQKDLKSEYYRGNSFDIGDFEANIPSMLALSHKAIEASLFRPYLFEANNIVMFISGLENAFILILTIIALYKVRVIYLPRFVLRNHMLMFSLIFSLFFAFAVGISTSNFGSLVRYKIPIIPFYIVSLYLLCYLGDKKTLERKENRKAPQMITLGSRI